ncbi:UPF0262 family protein [Marinivivus vitaminiproducens]|uniref:UPF0262 family protein n=1 Tax=Marinivivus vitaminiproducens TaxID=3035935 RepID=UPI0027A4B45D|nr:UPF0262 family protein [Geminicoccaceae bacterium SCSIO 64248]
MPAKPRSIVDIQLDQRQMVRWSPEIDHERRVALFDLLEANHFELKDGPAPPYTVEMALQDTTLVFRISAVDSDEGSELALPVRPLRKVIKDYFMVCETYFAAIRAASPQRIEAIDMGRRALHNEASALLTDALSDRVRIDHDTARRLFTLICVLHIRG